MTVPLGYALAHSKGRRRVKRDDVLRDPKTGATAIVMCHLINGKIRVYWSPPYRTVDTSAARLRKCELIRVGPNR